MSEILESPGLESEGWVMAQNSELRVSEGKRKRTRRVELRYDMWLI
jgi:hypothetical protein